MTLTAKQQDLAEKLSEQIKAYVAIVKGAAYDRILSIAEGRQGYETEEEYRYQMSKAREALDGIEYDAMRETEAIPFKASRNATINAFMRYVEALPSEFTDAAGIPAVYFVPMNSVEATLTGRNGEIGTIVAEKDRCWLVDFGNGEAERFPFDSGNTAPTKTAARKLAKIALA